MFRAPGTMSRSDWPSLSGRTTCSIGIFPHHRRGVCRPATAICSSAAASSSSRWRIRDAMFVCHAAGRCWRPIAVSICLTPRCAAAGRGASTCRVRVTAGGEACPPAAADGRGNVARHWRSARCPARLSASPARRRCGDAAGPHNAAGLSDRSAAERRARDCGVVLRRSQSRRSCKRSPAGKPAVHPDLVCRRRRQRGPGSWRPPELPRSGQHLCAVASIAGRTMWRNARCKRPAQSRGSRISTITPDGRPRQPFEGFDRIPCRTCSGRRDELQ